MSDTTSPQYFALLTKANVMQTPLAVPTAEGTPKWPNREKVRDIIGGWFLICGSLAASPATMLDAGLCWVQELLLATPAMPDATRAAFAERLRTLAAMIETLTPDDRTDALNERKHAVALLNSLESPGTFPTGGSDTVN